MKKTVNRLLCTILALLLLAAPLGTRVYANNNTTLQIISSQVMEIDETNSNQINCYTDASKTIKTGSVQVKLHDSPSYLSPVMSEDRIVYNIGSDSSSNVTVELSPNNVTNYIAPDSYTFGGNTMPLSTTQFDLTLTGGIQNLLSFDFKENNGGNPSGPVPDEGDMPGPMVLFPILAQFGVPDHAATEVWPNAEGNIIIPDNWTSGKVNFKAIVFIKNDGTVEPFNGQEDGGTINYMALHIEGIANGEEINETVTGSADHKSVIIQEGFSEFGKLQLHLVNEMDSVVIVNQLVNVVRNNLINIKADAPISLSQSFGTVAINQAIITKDEDKDVKIFFGNTETTLIVSGPNVQNITAVNGGLRSTLNDDGSATVFLESLSTATTTPVELTIQKTDGSSIERTVNIVRTAIQLCHSFDREKHLVYAGYVINKGYLYNNQPHNDAIFNAYLQVILYKDNVVAGYKQIKIDDAELVNSLQNNESGSMELYSEHQIAIYGTDAGNFIDGVNKVSVFLTNGPVDFNSETLPSVEFGIGSGVTIQFGGTTND